MIAYDLQRSPRTWLPRRLPSQTAGELTVNLAHPLAPAAMYLPSLHKGELVSGARISEVGSSGPPVMQATLYGPATVHGLGAGYLAGTGPFLGGLAAWSVCALMRSTAGGVLYCERATSGNDILKLIVNTGCSVAYRNDAGTLINPGSTTPAINTGDIFLASITFDNANVRRYHDGILDGTIAWSGANNNFTDASIQRTIGYDVADGSAYFTGNIIAVYLYQRTLAQAELVELQSRPFSMLSRKPVPWRSIAAAPPPVGGPMISLIT